VPITQVTSQAAAKQLASVRLLDQDHQVTGATTAGAAFYANYPASDAATQKLIDQLQAAKVPVEVDLQSGKPARRIVIQFLIPIMLLVCLFVFFTRLGADGGAGGIASFSNFRG
jgi:cell division protease FtsH